MGIKCFKSDRFKYDGLNIIDIKLQYDGRVIQEKDGCRACVGFSRVVAPSTTP